jgi:AraC family transcriptional regulator
MGTATMNTPRAIVSSRCATWDGIRVEHYKMQAGELPEHSHREHLILIPLSEGCGGEVRTAQGLSTRGVEMRGSVCVIPSQHSFVAELEGESEHLGLYLDPSLIARASGAPNKPVEVLERCLPCDPVITSAGMALMGEMTSAGPGGRLYAESLANVLAVHLLRHYTAAIPRDGEKFSGGLSGRTLRRVLDFIGDRYSTDLALSELAEVAGMSTFHFAREFKRATGKSPHQYLIGFRIEKAKELLKKHELPLVEVGFQSGFSHQSHFTRLFRRITGTTPQVYRAAMMG